MHLLFFLVTSMATKTTGWCEFAQLMSDHILCNINRNKFITVMNCNGMSYEIRRNH